MKQLIFSSWLVFSVCSLMAQTGKQFPELKGEFLNGKTHTLPAATNHQAVLIGLAYSKKAEENLETWFQPTFDKFVLKKGLFDGTYNVNPVFVPMFTGFNKAAEKLVSKALTENTPKEFSENVLVYRGPLEPYKTELKLTDKTNPYIFLVDKSGKILYQTYGAFSEKKMEKIADILDNL